MYTPKLFEFASMPDKIAFMKRYSFATIITSKEQVPIATQLPFVVDDSGDKLILRSHFAIVNEQTKYIADNVSLVIFSEPHAYISPRHYDKHESVPTWDYISVHAYGTASILESAADKLRVLEEMINFYEPDYLDRWNSLSDKYKTGMLQGIVAFELEVTDLQGQQKLSQNKTNQERERIIQELEKNGNGVEGALAGFIKNLPGKVS